MQAQALGAPIAGPQGLGAPIAGPQAPGPYSGPPGPYNGPAYFRVVTAALLPWGSPNSFIILSNRLT